MSASAAHIKTAGRVSDPSAYTREVMQEALRERIGQDYNVLAAARVAIAGCGGLGSNVAIFLARCGVGHLTLVDYDRIEASNLNRQQYRVEDLGKRKSDTLAGIITSVNPYLDVRAHNIRITPENFESLFAGSDIIIEAFDAADQKAMLANCARSAFPEVPLICGIGMAGCGPANWIRTRRLSDKFYVCGDEKSDVADVGSLYAPRVAICAGHMGTLAVQLLTRGADVALD